MTRVDINGCRNMARTISWRPSQLALHSRALINFILFPVQGQRCFHPDSDRSRVCATLGWVVLDLSDWYLDLPRQRPST